jgi:hypothetical protein
LVYCAKKNLATLLVIDVINDCFVFIVRLERSFGSLLYIHEGRCMTRVARYFYPIIPKLGKIYQMTIKYTKVPQDIPNDRKIDQMAIKYTNIFHSKTLQNFPKLVFLVLKIIWQTP